MSWLKEMPLSEDLKLWRAERPDEWTMDRFIRESSAMEKEIAELKARLEQYRLSLLENHSHWYYDETWLAANNLKSKDECIHCQLIRSL